MKFKNEKGITLVALVITVIILIILALVSISVSKGIIETTKFESLKTDLLLIQSKIKVMADKNTIGEIEEEDLYGVKQESGEYNGWYLLTQANLESIGIKNASASDQYYVNYENQDVAFGAGFEYENTIYYQLSEMNNENQI